MPEIATTQHEGPSAVIAWLASDQRVRRKDLALTTFSDRDRRTTP